MQLKARTLHELAEMVTAGSGSGFFGSGETDNRLSAFKYRSSSELTRFFQTCDTEHTHNGGSRVPWTEEVLAELNKGPCSRPDLPSDLIIRVIQELMDPMDYKDDHREKALAFLNTSLSREGVEAYLDGAGKCHVRTATGTSATIDIRARAFNQKDRETRAKWGTYLDKASEDEFTEKVLVPLLQSCGFLRITVAGHKDKALEYGKDLWMKLKLPTSHFIYFGIQVKKGKLDSAGKTKAGNENVTEAMNQIRMALQNPVMDPEMNRKVLLDHVYLITTGDITKAARAFLGEHLDTEQRRQLIFMDRDEILNLLVLTNMELPEAPDDSDIPF